MVFILCLQFQARRFKLIFHFNQLKTFLLKLKLITSILLLNNLDLLLELRIQFLIL
jgi:hypothetical protein